MRTVQGVYSRADTLIRNRSAACPNQILKPVQELDNILLGPRKIVVLWGDVGSRRKSLLSTPKLFKYRLTLSTAPLTHSLKQGDDINSCAYGWKRMAGNAPVAFRGEAMIDHI